MFNTELGNHGGEGILNTQLVLKGCSQRSRTGHSRQPEINGVDSKGRQRVNSGGEQGGLRGGGPDLKLGLRVRSA